ncbi:MAG: winged helix-turn-helix transcriptional regulator, partial [Methanomassiliicoccales archaeon]|nr:winged helix-turn-helix transcriptional regulator [Methanomassiliicoccales archaeon]
FHELGKSLGISAPSIQKRVAELERSGRVQKYVAYLHPDAFGCYMAIVQGHCKGVLTKKAVRMIGEHGTVRSLAYGAMNQVIAITVRRSSAELAELMSIMSEKCGIENLQTFLLGDSFFLGEKVKERFISKNVRRAPPELKRNDYRIILALKQNARKSLADIAKEVGISSKTVRRRLNRLIESNVIEFKVLKTPRSDQDIYFHINITLTSRSWKEAFFVRLRKDFHQELDRVAFFDNPPKAVFVDGLVMTIEELQSIVDRLAMLPEVETVTPNIVLKAYYFDTNLDKMLVRMAEG